MRAHIITKESDLFAPVKLLISLVPAVSEGLTYRRRKFPNALLHEHKVEVPYHGGIRIVLILLQQSSNRQNDLPWES
jgi:hypothetical protein